MAWPSSLTAITVGMTAGFAARINKWLDAINLLATPDDYTVLRANDPQTIPTGTWTALNMNGTSIWDPSNGRQANQRFWQVPETGRYTAAGSVSFEGNATGTRGLRFVRDTGSGTSYWPGREVRDAGTSAGISLSVAPGYDQFLNAGDLVSMECYQSSGGNLDTFLDTGGAATVFTVRMVSR